MLYKIQSFKTFFSPSIFFKIYDHDFLAFITVDVLLHSTLNIPADIYLLKVNNRNTRARCEICSKLTIKIPERRRSGIFIVNFDHISHLALLFPLLTLNM